MKMGWVVGLWMVFIGGAFLSGILEMQYLSGSGSYSASSIFNNLMTVPAVPDTGLLGFVETIGAIVVVTWNWVLAFINALFWNWTFLQGSWAIVKWILLYPLSIGCVVSLVLAIRGSSSS